jgi:hypothetical protein
MVALAAIISLLLPLAAQAQQYFDPGIMQKTFEAKPASFQANGVRLGSFMFWPGVELIYENNDNIFYDEAIKIEDSIWHVRPFFNLTSDWTRHSLTMSGWADIARYNDFSNLDYEDWALRLDGRFDVKRESFLYYELAYMHLHEDRRSPDARLGLFPTEFDYGGWGVGYDHTFNRIKLGGFLRRNGFDYQDNVSLDGDIIDNQFRDREEDTFTLRGDYLARPGRSYFLSFALTDISYDQPIDPNGFHRNSETSNAQAGIAWDLTGKLVGDLYGSWSSRDYDDPDLTDVDGFNLGAELSWTPTQLTTVNIRLAGGPQETTQNNTSGYFSNLYSARVQHELRRNLLLNARASYTDNDYEVLPGAVDALEETQVTRAGLGMTWLFNRHTYLSAGYVYESQDSNQPQFEYSTNRYFLTLGLEL